MGRLFNPYWRMMYYLTAFFIASVSGLLLTPLALKISIKGKVFDTEQDLHTFLADHLTTHMAGMLGGQTVHELISRAKKTA